jgi:hypothetical protein
MLTWNLSRLLQKYWLIITGLILPWIKLLDEVRTPNQPGE